MQYNRARFYKRRTDKSYQIIKEQQISRSRRNYRRDVKSDTRKLRKPDISEEEKQSKVLKEKMEQKWKTITGQTNNPEETLDKSTAIVMLQEFRNLMKNFNKVMGSHRP